MFDFIAVKFEALKKDKLFKFIFLAMFIKSIAFLALISDAKASKIVFNQLFIGVPQIIIYIMFIILFISFMFLFKNKGRYIYVIILDIVLTVIIIGDMWYYRSFGAFLNFHMIKMTSNLDNLGESILSMFRWVDILFIIDIPFIIWSFVKNFSNKVNRDSKLAIVLLATSILYLVYGSFKIDKLGRGYPGQYLFRAVWALNAQVFNLSPIGYHIYDGYRYFEELKPYELTEADKDSINNFYSKKEKGLPKNEHFGKYKGKNVIMLQVESLENFVINEKIEGQEITPNINKLLKNSYYFDNFREQTFNGTTSDAVFVANTSMLPVRRGAVNFNHQANEYNSLPNILEKYGYNTSTYHPEKGSYWNWKVAEHGMGFDKAYDISEFDQSETYGLGLADHSFLGQMPEKIKNLPEPFYSFMITISSHTPFDVPKEFEVLNLSDEVKNTKLGGYVGLISYTDKAIGEFMEKLDAEGVLDDTIVVLYGDHEGINKFYGDEVKEDQEIGKATLENDRRVPLIIYSKDNTEGKTISTNGGQVDLLPTLAALLGVEESEYKDTAMGRNLLNTNEDFTVLTKNAVEYRGKETSEEERSEKEQMMNVSDVMIKNNYFRNRLGGK